MSYIVNLTGVQPTLVSGENIKTINGETILGSGDLTIDKTDVGLGNVDNTSDLNKPISTATQTALNNKADLVGGKVPSSQIPAIAISEFLGAVNSQAAMLALLGQEGDWCIRTDVDLTYILIGTDPTDIDNWQEIVTPTGAVTSVNGYTGVVVLDQNDIGLGNVDDTSDLDKPISTATQTALNGKFNNPTGTSAQYIDGTGALQTFPTILDAGSLITEVYNNTGATLTKGTIVYINGGQGNLPTITKANASADATSAQTFGWVRNDITNNNNGYVIVAGKLSDLNTNGLGTGTQLYLSGTTSGAYTTTKPQAPIHLVYVGVVVRDHPTQGVIEVKIQNGYEIDELHDVQIASIANNQVLQYESSTQLWKNKSLTTSSVAASTDKNYVTDSQQVVIGNTSGTNTGDETQATIQSKLGTASTSTSGYLTSTDWNTFNGKQNALVSGTNIKTIEGQSLLGSGNIDLTKSDVGLGNVDNTSDLNKPISTATQTALNAKQDTITLTTTGTSGAATLVGSTLNIPNYASGGLTYFTEAQSTAAPNATINVDSLTAVASTANADFAIVSKGNGSIMFGVPNNATSGGNKRGINSVDLQKYRSAADQVVGGDASSQVGAENKTVGAFSGTYGNGNANNANYTHVLGRANTANGGSSILVGQFNSNSGTACGAFGHSNSLSNDNQYAIGAYNSLGNQNSIAIGRSCSDNGTNGRIVIGIAAFVAGDTQKSIFSLSKRTTDATQTSLTLAASPYQGATSVRIADNSAYRFKGTIIGKQSASTNICAWDIDGLIVRGVGAATTSLVLSNINLVQNTPAWGTPILSADTTQGCLKVDVIGKAATNIQWTAMIETTEVIYA